MARKGRRGLAQGSIEVRMEVREEVEPAWSALVGARLVEVMILFLYSVLCL